VFAFGGAECPGPPEPVVTTTPSRVASFREQAEVFRAAIECLLVDVREVLRMRILEQRELGEIARMLDLPLATVQHRVRRGAKLYRDRLRTALALSTVYK